MKLFFLIRSLDVGGAERQLVTLANGLAARGHAVHLAVFYSGGELESNLRGVTLHDLRKSGRWDSIGFLSRLIGLIRKLRPQVVYGFLGTPNLLTSLLRPFCPSYRSVWGVRSAFMDLARYGTVARLHYRMERLFAPLASAIVVNSQAGKAHALKMNFPDSTLHVISNGIDTERYRPAPEIGLPLRKQWNIPKKALAIGLPGRLDPMKDHSTFLAALALVITQRPEVHGVCIGGGPQPYRTMLHKKAKALGLDTHLHWAGHCADMAAAYNALDLVCLSSYGEGFPNVLGEAMACGTPCAATDVGDCADILGQWGTVCPPKEPEHLAEAILRMIQRLENEGGQLQHDCRTHIQELFSVTRMVQATETLLSGLIR